MKIRTRVTVATLAIMLLAGGCASSNNAHTGAAIGGLSGALLGSWVGSDQHQSRNAILLGLIGAGAGYAIGNEMDKTDARQVGAVLETGPSNAPVTWRNPDSGNRYTVTPRPAYENAGQVCREVEIDAWMSGRSEVIEATACRRPDGSWFLADSASGHPGNGFEVVRRPPPRHW